MEDTSERESGGNPGSNSFTLAHLVIIICLLVFGAMIAYPILSRPTYGSGPSLGMMSSKQINLAAIMYANDYDTSMPLGTSWHTGKDQLCLPVPVGCFSTWAWSIQAYMKTPGLFADASATPNPKRMLGQDRFDTWETQFGYNYTFLSPYIPVADPANSNQHVIGVSHVSATAPAQRVMVASKWARSNLKTLDMWGTGFPGGMLLDAAVDPPVCAPLPQMCVTNWGDGGFFDRTNPKYGMLLDPVEGRYTGGVAFRTATQAVVGFLDGHSKKLTERALAVGTNYAPGIPAASVVVTSSSSYLWSLKK